MLDKAVQNYSNCTCRCAYLTACDADDIRLTAVMTFSDDSTS